LRLTLNRRTLCRRLKEPRDTIRKERGGLSDAADRGGILNLEKRERFGTGGSVRGGGKNQSHRPEAAQLTVERAMQTDHL